LTEKVKEMKTHITVLRVCFILPLSLIFSQESNFTIDLSGSDSLSIVENETDHSDKEIPDSMVVDLSGGEYPFIDEGSSAHILAKPWYRNSSITGFGGMGFLQTGAAGTRPNGGFLIKEASLFWEQDIWNDISFFIEVQTNRLGMDSTLFIRTGEVYIYFRSLFQREGKKSV